MRSSVSTSISRAPDLPRNAIRNRNSRVIGWGNFGAPPKPPHRASNEPRSRSSAASAISSPSAPVGGSELPGVRDRLRHACALDLDLVAPGLPGVGDPLQDLAERRHAVPGLVGEVRARVERLPVRREEDRHRPAARAGHRLDRVHVDPVHVGTLLPVHLHSDEPRVEQGRGLGVFERLPLHHVAPVAGRVADRQEHGAVLGPGPREGLVAPRVPVDRVVGVLQEVGALLSDEPVRVALGHAASLARPRASHTSPQVGAARAHARGRVRRW